MVLGPSPEQIFMKIKIALLDFDGTLVIKDILDLLCRAAGRERESEEINAAFHRGEIRRETIVIDRSNDYQRNPVAVRGLCPDGFDQTCGNQTHLGSMSH